MDIYNKLNKYLKITGIINNVFRPKKTRIKLYYTLDLPALLYNSSSMYEIYENSRIHLDRS
jgi:hypothetical protein